MDHGFFGEPAFLAGIEDMEAVVDVLVEAAPDAIQLTVGQAELLQRRPGKNRPALVLRTDVANVYGPTLPERLFSRMIDDAATQAVRLDAACVVVNLFDIPGQPALREGCLENILRLKPACDAVAMPLMIEPLVMRPNEEAGGYMVDGNAERIVALVRQAAELGADVIKADPTDDISQYGRVVTVAGVPVLVRGGGRVPDAELLARTAGRPGPGRGGDRLRAQHHRPHPPGGHHAGAHGVGPRGSHRRGGARHGRAGLMSTPEPVGIGLIGGGLMGRELAAAVGRWTALEDHPVRPRLAAVCDTSPAALEWFGRVDGVRRSTTDRRSLLEDPAVQVVYVALPHNLHEEVMVEVAEAGKDLLGEKPFGFDEGAAERIVAAVERAGIFARCSSEMPYFPGAQLALSVAASGALGQLVEATSSFLHSSDLDPRSRSTGSARSAPAGPPAAWPTWHARASRAASPGLDADLARRLAPEPRPRAAGRSGGLAICDTVDNATLFCTSGAGPLTVETKRIAPGNMNTWRFFAVGMDGGIEFSTRAPKTVRRFRVDEGAQVWERLETAANRPSPPSPGPSSSSGSPTPCSRCGRPIWQSGRVRWTAASAVPRPGRRWPRTGSTTPRCARRRAGRSSRWSPSPRLDTGGGVPILAALTTMSTTMSSRLHAAADDA